MNSRFDPMIDRTLDHTQVALRRWGDVSVFRSHHGPGRFAEHEHPEAQISIRVESAQDAGLQRVDDSLHVIPPGVPHSATLATPAEFVLVYVDPGGLEAEADDIGHSQRLDIGRPDRTDDDWLGQVVAELRVELDADAFGGLIGEALSLATRTRLLTHHLGETRPTWAHVQPLTARELRRTLALMRQGICDRVGVEAIAAELGMGVSRFAKSFRAATGEPPHRYLMRLRAEVARELLETTRTPLVQVAMRSGFSSQSHLTEHCRRFFGVTPGQIRAAVGGGH